MFQSKTAGESDSEREDMELSEISKVLEKHDPSYNRCVHARVVLKVCTVHMYTSSYTCMYICIACTCIIIEILCFLPPLYIGHLMEPVVISRHTTSSVWVWRDWGIERKTNVTTSLKHSLRLWLSLSHTHTHTHTLYALLCIFPPFFLTQNTRDHFPANHGWSGPVWCLWHYWVHPPVLPSWSAAEASWGI